MKGQHSQCAHARVSVCEGVCVCVRVYVCENMKDKGSSRHHSEIFSAL